MRFLIPHNKQTASWTELANTFLAGPESGSAAHPLFRRLAAADFNDALKVALGIGPPIASSGTVIAFDKPRTYGYSTAETGNVTLNATGLVEGMTQLLIHNHSSEPTFPATMKIVGGAYVISVNNYIVLYAVKSDLILVTISQEV